GHGVMSRLAVPASSLTVFRSLGTAEHLLAQSWGDEVLEQVPDRVVQVVAEREQSLRLELGRLALRGPEAVDVEQEVRAGWWSRSLRAPAGIDGVALPWPVPQDDGPARPLVEDHERLVLHRGHAELGADTGRSE